MYKFNYKKLIFIFAMSIITTILLGFYLKSLDGNSFFDYIFMSLFQKNNIFRESEFLLSIVKGITFFGNTEIYFILGIPLLFYLGFKREYGIIKVLLLAIFLSFLLNLAIKNIVCRTRPVEFFVIIEKGYSFPSGHAMVSSSFYLTLGYILADRFNKKFIFKLSVIFVILISISRVILGVHWITDIIVGFVLGFLCFNISIKFYIDRRV